MNSEKTKFPGPEYGADLQTQAAACDMMDENPAVGVSPGTATTRTPADKAGITGSGANPVDAAAATTRNIEAKADEAQHTAVYKLRSTGEYVAQKAEEAKDALGLGGRKQ